MKKARKWLEKHDIEYQFYDYKKAGIAADTLKNWAKQVGWETLLNKRGTTWRKLPEGTKQGVTQQTAIKLMVESPSLIKRPVIVKGKNILVGFDELSYRDKLA